MEDRAAVGAADYVGSVGPAIHLAMSVDVYRTSLAIAGAASPQVTGRNLLPFLAAPVQFMSLTETAYAERFHPNSTTVPCDTHEQAIRDYRYKVIRLPGGDQSYDLWQDPRETGSGAVPGLTDLCVGRDAAVRCNTTGLKRSARERSRNGLTCFLGR